MLFNELLHRASQRQVLDLRHVAVAPRPEFYLATARLHQPWTSVITYYKTTGKVRKVRFHPIIGREGLLGRVEI
jgi:hypothetical protein